MGAPMPTAPRGGTHRQPMSDNGKQTMTHYLNLDALASSQTRTTPYPYFVVEESIDPNRVGDVMRDFPRIENGGSYTLEDLQSGPAFSALIEELNGPEFRRLISEKLDMDLSQLPMIVTLRGVSRAKDGRIHTDSKSKIATILIYFNEPWTAATGRLRILNSNNMDDMADEVTPNAGTLLAFRVTDNCWHGYPPFEGVRRSIQINFVADDAAVKKHHHRHGWTARIKSLAKRLQRH